MGAKPTTQLQFLAGCTPRVKHIDRTYLEQKPSFVNAVLISSSSSFICEDQVTTKSMTFEISVSMI